MGRQQLYKGNPELKQYYLVNDFSGGINTTDVDERTADNEFRELLNVELIRAGMLQNRKGWGLTRLLNLLLESPSNATGENTPPAVSLPTYQLNGSTIPVDQYALIQIVKNVGNILPLIEEYDEKNVSLAQFKSYGFNYDLEILMIYSDLDSIKLGLLKLSSSSAQGANSFTVIATIASNITLSETRPLTNIETISFSDKIYFSLSQLKENLPGLGEYDIDDKTFRFVRDDADLNSSIYKPNPYEATKVGFNVLSANPLTDVSTVSTLFSITGVFLTTFDVSPTTNILNDSQTPIQSIPLNGKFTVNTLYTGQNVSVNDFTLKFFSFKNDNQGIPQEVEIPFTLKAIKQEDEIGVLRFAVEVDIKGYNEINMRIIGRNGILFTQTFVRFFPTTEDMVEYFNPDTNSRYVTFANNRYTLFTKTNLPYTYDNVSELTYENKTFPITDDASFGTSTIKVWETSSATAYNNQVGNKGEHRPAGECDQTIFDGVNVTSLNTTGSFLPTSQYNTNYIAEVRKSRTVQLAVPERYFWSSTTTSSPIGSSQTVTPSQFDAFKISSLPTLPSSSYKVNHIRRIIAYTSVPTTTFAWQEVSSGTASETIPGPTSSTSTCPVISASTVENLYGSGPSQNYIVAVTSNRTVNQTTGTTYAWVNATEQDFNSAAGTSTVNVSPSSNDTSCVIFNSVTSSNVSNYAGAPSSYSDGHIVKITSNTVFGGSNVVCGNKYYRATHTPVTSPVVQPCTSRLFRWTEVQSSTQELYGVKYYIVNYQAAGTTTNRVDCEPVEVKYFKLVSQPVGEGITYSASTKKIQYRLNNTRTDIYSNVELIPSLSTIKPNIGSRYLIGSVPTDQTKYYLYNGGAVGDLTDFTNITFSEAITETEYVDTYVVSEPTLRKIEALDITGFRILEAWNRLIYYKENIIWFSDLYQFDYIPNYNYVVLPLSPNDKIMSINYFKGSYIIFTKDKIYKMSGTFGAEDFQIQMINDTIGCISSFSVKGFNNTLVFMTHDGLYRIKQNYYQNGLENVEKIDRQLDGIVPYNIEVYSLLYNEQYLLIYDYTEGIPDSGFNVLKLYYNMSAPNGFPYVKDRYSIVPTVIGQFDDGLYSIKYGKFYKYDKGYTDFLPPNETVEDLDNPSLYTVKIRTHKLSFGYPTHEKKFKSILIKDIANEPVPLLFDIYINNFRVYQHTQFQTTVNDLGEIVYEPILTNPVIIGSNNLLGNFELNKDQLGDLSARVHKIVFAGKGKDILIDIERKTAQQFSIQDIGYIYKVGKAREDR
jgi:hypothetical protein